jgi:lipoate-protein ligase A
MKNFPAVHLLALEGVPIFEQLQLEEALLRAGTENFCIMNHQSAPAIVMGISGKPEELIDPHHFRKNPVPVIRRFSGGGCVLINEDTLFLTFIFNRHDADIGTCPKRLLEWTETILKPVFKEDFSVRENDYVLGDKKCGGNAQYFTKSRWLDHTSLLWDFSDEAMNVLQMPQKRPEYRQNRNHSDFLTRLNGHFSTKKELFESVTASLKNQYRVIPTAREMIDHMLMVPHRKATQEISPAEQGLLFCL